MRDAASTGHPSSRAQGPLRRGLLTREEEKRRRIAQQLQDGTLQDLAAAALTLDLLAADLDAGPAGDQLTRARRLTLSAMHSIRRLAADLHPSLLDHLGLAAALRAYADLRLAGEGIEIRVDAADTGASPASFREIILYRVGHEAIDNIAAHAEAKIARIALGRNGRRLTLVVEDDGKGFEPAEILARPDAGSSPGILSMLERIDLVGGTLAITSVPGKGTCVRAEVPHKKDGP